MKKRKSQTPMLPVSPDGLIGAEAYTSITANGLVRIHVRFGMTRQPAAGDAGPPEVYAAFKDMATKLRAMADTVDASAEFALLGQQVPS